MKISFKKESNTEKVIAEMQGKTESALMSVGIAGENNAKIEITEMGAVDTGNLRNSISNTTDERTAYIGTDVEYAPAVEYGSSRYPNPRPFLQSAVENHSDEYREIIESVLKG